MIDPATRRDTVHDLHEKLVRYWHDVDFNSARSAGGYYCADAVFEGNGFAYTGRAEIEEVDGTEEKARERGSGERGRRREARVGVLQARGAARNNRAPRDDTGKYRRWDRAAPATRRRPLGRRRQERPGR